jgi:hypothetical protein
MIERFYAHSLEGKLPEERQLLEEHLKNVAELARSFAEPFGGGGIQFRCPFGACPPPGRRGSPCSSHRRTINSSPQRGEAM